MKLFVIYLLSSFISVSVLAEVPSEIQGNDVVSGKASSVTNKEKDKKALVVVFVSAKCPCSDSHILELKNLAQKYKDFQFIAIHSNPDETAELAKTYFTKAELPFSVIQDTKTQLADAFKAFKTPHAFVVNTNGDILYQGGVTNSANASKADKHFLADALEDIEQGRKVKNENGRTLGCIIMRESEHNTW